jgi:hypothetical protein
MFDRDSPAYPDRIWGPRSHLPTANGWVKLATPSYLVPCSDVRCCRLHVLKMWHLIEKLFADLIARLVYGMHSLSCSNIEIVGSNTNQDPDVCVRLLCVSADLCAFRIHATS